MKESVMRWNLPLKILHEILVIGSISYRSDDHILPYTGIFRRPAFELPEGKCVMVLYSHNTNRKLYINDCQMNDAEKQMLKVIEDDLKTFFHIKSPTVLLRKHFHISSPSLLFFSLKTVKSLFENDHISDHLLQDNLPEELREQIKLV